MKWCRVKSRTCMGNSNLDTLDQAQQGWTEFLLCVIRESLATLWLLNINLTLLLVSLKPWICSAMFHIYVYFWKERMCTCIYEEMRYAIKRNIKLFYWVLHVYLLVHTNLWTRHCSLNILSQDDSVHLQLNQANLKKLRWTLLLWYEPLYQRWCFVWKF